MKRSIFYRFPIFAELFRNRLQPVQRKTITCGKNEQIFENYFTFRCHNGKKFSSTQ